MTISSMPLESLEDLNCLPQPLHMAIGVFDGVHLGHQAVIEAAIQSAKRSEGTAVILTFDPHPSQLFRPQHPTCLLMPRSTKERFLFKMGVARVIFQPFNEAFAAIEAEHFAQYLKGQLPGLQAVYVGENFRYGKGRQGDVTLLIQTSKTCAVDVFSAERIRKNGEPISSTRIREALCSGKIEWANALLGHCYSSSGKIVAGQKLGTRMGFPTLNLPWEPELLPKFGVYCVKVRLRGKTNESWLPGVANYGIRPTIIHEGRVSPLLEVHTFQPIAWQPPEEITVLWKKFIRPEKKFPNLEALKVQIAVDRRTALAFSRR